MNQLPDPDDAFESLLADALATRGRRVRPGAGSLVDVRTRARRRARRRTATGVGALAVLGSVGAVVATTRGDDNGPVRLLAAGDAGDGASGDAANVDGSTVWRCTGMLAGSSFPTVVPTTVEVSPSSTIAPETLTPTSTVPSANPATTVIDATDTTFTVVPSTAVVDPTPNVVVSGDTTMTSVLPVFGTVVPEADDGYLMTGCMPLSATQTTTTTIAPASLAGEGE